MGLLDNALSGLTSSIKKELNTVLENPTIKEGLSTGLRKGADALTAIKEQLNQTSSESVTKPKAFAAIPAKQVKSACPPPPPSFSYHAIIDGLQRGPYNQIQFKRLVDANMVNAQTKVWCEGMDEWKNAGEIPAMEDFFPKNNPSALSSSFPHGCPPLPVGCPPLPLKSNDNN